MSPTRWIFFLVHAARPKHVYSVGLVGTTKKKPNHPTTKQARVTKCLRTKDINCSSTVKKEHYPVLQGNRQAYHKLGEYYLADITLDNAHITWLKKFHISLDNQGVKNIEQCSMGISPGFSTICTCTDNQDSQYSSQLLCKWCQDGQRRSCKKSQY